jgi:hypothetical protein
MMTHFPDGNPRTQRLTTFLAQTDWLIQPALAFCASRLLIFCAGLLGDHFLPTEAGHWVADPNHPFLDLWAKWDSQWYIQIAREGYWYQPLQRSNVAFFPLYPLMIRMVAPLAGGNLVLAGFVISHVAFFVALIYLYRLALLELGERAAAQRTLFYLAFFPTSFFFSAVFTESLFLLLAVVTMDCARRQQWLAAGVAGMLAAATRSLGVLLWALVLWEWLRVHGWRITTLHRRASWRNLATALRTSWYDLFAIALIPLGLLLYVAFLQRAFDQPLAFIDTQAHWGRQTVGPVRVLLREAEALLAFEWNRSNLSRLLNMAATLGAVAMTPFVWRRLGEGYAIYVLLAVLLPASSAMMSMIRYVLTVFPLFLLLGWWGRRTWVDQLLLSGFALLLGVLTTIFVNWVFVA